ncbi:prostaglandin reductase 1-like isoform X1 [Cephus cinctus]|uniref:Prostaglandin reductase 1 n=1 Tax=Cephus cinctus TaxID=211228 RepID=A0AAJ7CD59_CEPCN|nr:prostaglandin reductase 1-like isoform X1 [Cephus cinctus]
MVKARKYLIGKVFQGEPKRSDLTLVEEELPPLKNGDFLIEAEYLSVDPYMRAFTPALIVGNIMMGTQVGKIIESKNPGFPVGRRVVANVGWRTHTIIDEKTIAKNTWLETPYLMPDFGNLPSSLGLGVLGMTGNSAYFGLLEICKPEKGKTIVISAAAGAVGSHAGQIAKIYGLKVIGIAGSDIKCKWIKEDLGFDHVINYKTQDIDAVLKEAAPEGVDYYFDNVGGATSRTVTTHMNAYGIIAACGCISFYNADPNTVPESCVIQTEFINRRLKMEGFVVYQWYDRWFEGIEKNIEWIRQGKVKYRETITHGFENMFDVFIGMLRGENIGKAIVKA